MMKSRYSNSPYGKMRDRMEENNRKAIELKRKHKKEDDYYTWLITGNK